jgi:hypothetical protein
VSAREVDRYLRGEWATDADIAVCGMKLAVPEGATPATLKVVRLVEEVRLLKVVRCLPHPNRYLLAVDWVAAHTGLSNASVSRALRWLHEHGVLIWCGVLPGSGTRVWAVGDGNPHEWPTTASNPFRAIGDGARPECEPWPPRLCGCRPPTPRELLSKYVARAAPGCRNSVGHALACQLHDHRVDGAIASLVMSEYASQVGLPGEEVMRTLRSVYGRPERRREPFWVRDQMRR